MEAELATVPALNEDAMAMAEEAHIATTDTWASFFDGEAKLYGDIRCHIYGPDSLSASEQIELIDTMTEFVMGRWLLHRTFDDALILWDALPEWAQRGDRDRIERDIHYFHDSDGAWKYVDRFILRHLHRKFDQTI